MGPSLGFSEEGEALPLARTCLYLVPGQDRCEDCCAAPNDGVLVAAGQASPVFESVEGSFDDIAAAVGGGVEPGWSSPEAASPLAVCDLVGGLRDDGPDVPASQLGAVCSSGVGLVGGDRVGPRPRPATVETALGQLTERHRAHGAVVDVADHATTRRSLRDRP